MFFLTTLPPSTVLSARLPPTTPATIRTGDIRTGAIRTGAMRTAFAVDVLSRIRICHRLDIITKMAAARLTLCVCRLR